MPRCGVKDCKLQCTSPMEYAGGFFNIFIPDLVGWGKRGLMIYAGV